MVSKLCPMRILAAQSHNLYQSWLPLNVILLKNSAHFAMAILLQSVLVVKWYLFINEICFDQRTMSKGKSMAWQHYIDNNIAPARNIGELLWMWIQKSCQYLRRRFGDNKISGYLTQTYVNSGLMQYSQIWCSYTNSPQINWYLLYPYHGYGFVVPRFVVIILLVATRQIKSTVSLILFHLMSSCENKFSPRKAQCFDILCVMKSVSVIAIRSTW